MDGPPSRLLPPYLGAAMVLLLGALFVVIGLLVRDYDLEANQGLVDPDEVRVDAVVVAHRDDGWPLGKRSEVRRQDVGSPSKRAFINGWVGAPGETIEVIVPTRPDRNGQYWGRLAPPPEPPRPPMDYSGIALLFGSGFVVLGLAIAIRDYRGRTGPVETSDYGAAESAGE